MNINIVEAGGGWGKQSCGNVKFKMMGDSHWTHCHHQIGRKKGNFRSHEIMQTASRSRVTGV
jgi:hypothetical protein